MKEVSHDYYYCTSKRNLMNVLAHSTTSFFLLGQKYNKLPRNAFVYYAT